MTRWSICVLVVFMDQTAPLSLADRIAITRDGMRAAVAAEGTRKGPAAALLAAILSFLECLLALLAEFNAGKLAAVRDHSGPGASAARAAEPRLARAERSARREPRLLLAASSADRSGVGGADSGRSVGRARHAATFAPRPRIAWTPPFAAPRGSIRATAGPRAPPLQKIGGLEGRPSSDYSVAI